MNPNRSAQRVLLLGWDGADWKIIQPLVDAGRMPHLQRLIEGGVMGNLATLKPILSPMLWTSVATGKLADWHGIHGFVEPRPDGAGVQPVSSASVRAAPLWDIVERAGLASAVVGWFATHPADLVSGTVVSNLVVPARGADFDAWPLPPRSVSPAELRDVMGDLRVHPTEMDADQLRFFVPRAAEIDPREDERLPALIRLLAQCGTVHATGTWLAERDGWDLLAVYYETIDRLCHWFMECRAPRMAHASERDVELYGEVIDRVYEFHDLMLGRYMRLVGPDTTIVIVSDHGFFSDHLRPPVSSHMQAGAPVEWHRDLGILVAAGPGLRRDALAFGATLLDVAPTVLAMLGLPVARDMEGRVLTQLFEQPPAVALVDTHGASAAAAHGAGTADSLDVAPGRPTTGGEAPASDPTFAPPAESQAALEQLAALGYIEAPGEDAGKAVVDATAQRHANLAEVQIARRDFAAAKAHVDALLALRPGYPNGRLKLAQCYLQLGDLEACKRLVSAILGDRPGSHWAHFILGQIHFAEGRDDEALAAFGRAQSAGRSFPGLHNRIGAVHLRHGRWARAEAAFTKALEIDGDSAPAYHGIGVARLRRGRPRQAVTQLLRAIGLRYHYPVAHYHLGLALAATGDARGAGEAFARALEQRPNLADESPGLAAFQAAQRGTAAGVPGGGPDQGETAQGETAESETAQSETAPGTSTRGKATDSGPGGTGARAASGSPAPEDVVTVVTGLPRSGTSMMMQMLAAGGVPVLSDGRRAPDEDNPRGYLELEAVKRTREDPGWVAGARGHAVKMVYSLLRDLPPGFHYRLLLIGRPLPEVLASQERMLARLAALSGATREPADEAALASVFASGLADVRRWAGARNDVELLCVDYHATLARPAETARAVAAFLGRDLDAAAMAAAVDRSLHRNRVGVAPAGAGDGSPPAGGQPEGDAP